MFYGPAAAPIGLKFPLNRFFYGPRRTLPYLTLIIVGVGPPA